MRPILVTGATGFLGRHLVEHLKRTETLSTIRVLCRGASTFDQDSAVEVVRGDVTESRDVDRAMEGAGYVYHLAGFVSRDPRDAERLMRAHVEGTRNVCESSIKHRVERVVVVSSSGTIAVSKQPVVHDEQAGYKNDIVGRWPYYLSKIFQEKLAFWFHQNKDLPVVVVNPALLLGPGDDRGSSTGDIRLFLEGQILSMPLGGVNFIDARDAAEATASAMRLGRVGQRYLLGGPNWTCRKLVRELSEIAAVRPPIFEMGLGGARFGAKMLRWIKPGFQLDDATIEMSAHFWYCNSAKAEAELGLKVRDPQATLTETIDDIRRRSRPSV